jgi:hypothetical protein
MPVPAHTLLGAHAAPEDAGFDASDWGTVLLEYDASDTATITASGGAVSAWAPKSGSLGLTAAQGTAANKPTTGTRTQNGLNVLDFDGGDFLSVDIDPDEAQQVTIACVCGPDGTGNAHVIGNQVTPQTTLLIVSATWRYFAGTTINSTINVTAAPHILIGVFNGASSVMWVDGAAGATGNTGTAALKTVAIGASAAGTNALNGWIGHVIYYDGAVSSLANLSAALNDKWAVYA